MIKLFLVATLAITSYAGVVYEFKGSSTLFTDTQFTDETATLTLPGFITSAAEYLPGVNLVCSICSHFGVNPVECFPTWRSLWGMASEAQRSFFTSHPMRSRLQACIRPFFYRTR
jgi:hypothetical protein